MSAFPSNADRAAELPGSVLALDLGATQIRAAMVAPDGSIAYRRRTDTNAQRGSAAVVGDSIGLLEAVRLELPFADQRALEGIGISAPGPLDPHAGRLIEPPNLGPAFRNVALTAPIEAALALPAVLERDTNVAALAEQAFGAARDVRDFIYITVSTGIGGGIVSRGDLLGGPDGVAGEIGHLPVLLDGPPCGCGARGHLEAVSSGAGIARAATEAARAGASPALQRRLAVRGALDARDVERAAAEGDREAAAIMDRAERAFAAAIVGLVDVFNPELIVVGGGIVEAHGERWLARARDEVARLAFRVPASRVRIVAAALGRDVSLVGALPLVRRAAGDAPKPTPAVAPRHRSMKATGRSARDAASAAAARA